MKDKKFRFYVQKFLDSISHFSSGNYKLFMDNVLDYLCLLKLGVKWGRIFETKCLLLWYRVSFHSLKGFQRLYHLPTRSNVEKTCRLISRKGRMVWRSSYMCTVLRPFSPTHGHSRPFCPTVKYLYTIFDMYTRVYIKIQSSTT